jgi:hypothetical protein
MRRPSDSNEDDPFLTNRQGLFVLFAVFRAWSISMEVFVRHNMGVRYPGPLSALVLLLVPIYCLFWEGYDLVPMLYFLGAYIVMCARHRLTVGYRYLTGTADPEHTYYSGYPYLLYILRQYEEIPVKMIAEPALIAFCGVLIGGIWNQPLGWYLIIGAVCSAATVLLGELLHRRRLANLRDQVIEQRQLMADYLRRS